MNMKIVKLLLLVGLLMNVSFALADCVYDGRSYGTGTVINGLTCQADGSWR